jgi:hypothetical protein
MFAGIVASRSFHEGASLAELKLEMRSLAAKRRCKREYGVLAAEYTREFDRRWLRDGSHDLFMQLIGATPVPFAPPVFTMIPPGELLDRIIKTVF